MSFLVDTNVISELRKGRRAHPQLRAWLLATKPPEIYFSVLVIGELRQGVERIRARDAASALRLDRWVEALAHEYETRILGVDVAVAELWGRLNARRRLPVVDGLLAATAIVHGLTLVTRNVRDVAPTGVQVFDPFAAR